MSKLLNIKNLVTNKKPAKKKTLELRQIPERIEKDKKIIHFDTFFKLQPRSVQDYIEECHPDVKTFLSIHEACSIKRQPGKLIIQTRDELRMEITDLKYNERRVIVSDKRNHELFNEITKLPNKKTT